MAIVEEFLVNDSDGLDRIEEWIIFSHPQYDENTQQLKIVVSMEVVTI